MNLLYYFMKGKINKYLNLINIKSISILKIIKKKNKDLFFFI